MSTSVLVRLSVQYDVDHLCFDNAFVRDLPGDPSTARFPRQVFGAMYSLVQAEPVAAPRLIAYSSEIAGQLGFTAEEIQSQRFADVFGGNVLLPGMQPFASNYGGHQFGQWAGQLGDGRAITLGEVLDADHQRWELQLKGAGPTPYSRGADGRAVLRSSIREFLCSEAMHHLGVPTTRALSLVATGEDVLRDMFYDGNPQFEQGAIVCRVAPSFIRFGHFQLPASRGEKSLLEQLVSFTIRRDFPQLVASAGTGDTQAVRAEWFAQVCERTARMVAAWMALGFVHGVMNTDNMSILGLTIDYGPYGWIDNFDPGWTPNTTDMHTRRYRFGQQPEVAYWNLQQLARALVPVFPAVDALNAGLDRYVSTLEEATRAGIAAKLGLLECTDADVELMQSLNMSMEKAEVDLTVFFRRLSEVRLDTPDLTPLRDAFYDAEKMMHFEPEFQQWLLRYSARARTSGFDPVERRARMNAANPRYVLRNYLAQLAIDRAEQGDEAGITELLDVLRHPYDDQPGKEAFAALRPDWARERAGCSMLSCSS
jgi:uncharacterized protein YdiU (UPF0061 family)